MPNPEDLFADAPWFVIGLDRNLLGDPVFAGLYGPFTSRQKAERYAPRVEENGTTLVIHQALNPATYP